MQALSDRSSASAGICGTVSVARQGSQGSGTIRQLLHGPQFTHHISQLHFTLHSLHTFSHVKPCELNDLSWTSGGPNVQQTAKFDPINAVLQVEGMIYSTGQ
jgi:hypothetical protein